MNIETSKKGHVLDQINEDKNTSFFFKETYIIIFAIIGLLSYCIRALPNEFRRAKLVIANK